MTDTTSTSYIIWHFTALQKNSQTSGKRWCQCSSIMPSTFTFFAVWDVFWKANTKQSLTTWWSNTSWLSNTFSLIIFSCFTISKIKINILFIFTLSTDLNHVFGFGEKIKNEVELSTAVVVVMSAIPINFSACLANVECLKDFQGPFSHRRFDWCPSFCLFFATKAFPFGESLVLGKVNHRIFLGILGELDELFRYRSIAKLHFDHLNLWCHQEFITVANHATTEHVVAFNVDLEVLHNLSQSLQVVVILVHQEAETKARVLLILKERILIKMIAGPSWLSNLLC